MSKTKIEIWGRKVSSNPTLINRLRIKVDRDGVRHIGSSPIGYETLTKNYELILDEFDENGNPINNENIVEPKPETDTPKNE